MQKPRSFGVHDGKEKASSLKCRSGSFFPLFTDVRESSKEEAVLFLLPPSRLLFSLSIFDRAIAKSEAFLDVIREPKGRIALPNALMLVYSLRPRMMVLMCSILGRSKEDIWKKEGEEN